MTKDTNLYFSLIFAAIFCGFFFTSCSQEPPPATVYTIALDDTWYPLQLYDKEQDLTAFSEDLVQAIASTQHFSVEFDLIPSESLYSGLDLGEYDAILSSLVVTEENKEPNYVFSNPYFLLGEVLVVPTSSALTSIHDLNGKNIGVITGSKPIVSIYKNPLINLIFYDYNNVSKLVDDVNNKVIDGMIVNVLSAYEYTKSDFYHLKIISEPLTHSGLRLIAKSNSPGEKLIQEFNQGLIEMKKNGTYLQLINKWALFNAEKL